MAVLGISTNTRLVSVALISHHQLIDYFTNLHKASWSPAKADQIIASLEPCVRQYCIKSVVLSIPHAYHQTKEHKALIRALQTFFTKQHITVSTQTPAAFTPFYKEGKKKTKKVLMQEVVQLFPELHSCYTKEMRNKNKYYYKLFEAVAVATLAEMELN